jgi:hypothetical protein
VFELPIVNPNRFVVTPETQHPIHRRITPIIKYLKLSVLPKNTLTIHTKVNAPPINKLNIPMISKTFVNKNPIWNRKVVPYKGKKIKRKPNIPR